MNITKTIPNLPDAEYRALPGLSQSAMKALARSPAHYQAALATPMEATDAMQLGRIVHHIALTPDEPDFWRVRPEGMDGRTKEGKAWAAENAGSVIIKPDVFQRAYSAAEAALRHPVWPQTGDAELSITGEISGVTVKGRLDLLDGNTVYDIKTTQDARTDAFQRTFFNLSYHVQAAFYCDLAGVGEFVFVAVETDAPFGCKAYRVSQDALEAGRSEYHRLLALYRSCSESGIWPAYGTDTETLNLPAWARP